MPNIKAAEKWVQQSERRETRNKAVKSRLKTLFKVAVASGQPDAARNLESAFDAAASKGIVHRNKAARKKARLAKAVKRVAAAPVKSAKTKSGRAKK
ncbi:MAG TPA: 30S ribosomal protein S20 [Candidatus Cybelea sp.]